MTQEQTTERSVEFSLRQHMQENFDTTAISAQVIPMSTYNEEGENIEVNQLVVLDAQDRFMFIIGYAAAPEYLFDGYVNYEKIFRDFILSEEQWQEIQSNKAAEAEPEGEAVQEEATAGTNVPV